MVLTMTSLTPEQAAKIQAAVDAMPPLPDESIARVAAVIFAGRKRRMAEVKSAIHSRE